MKPILRLFELNEPLPMMQGLAIKAICEQRVGRLVAAGELDGFPCPDGAAVLWIRFERCSNPLDVIVIDHGDAAFYVATRFPLWAEGDWVQTDISKASGLPDLSGELSALNDIIPCSML